MSLKIEEPLFFRITLGTLVTRMMTLIRRLSGPLAIAALGLAAFHGFAPFSRESLGFLEPLGVTGVSAFGLFMVAPLYLAFITVYAFGMAALQEEPPPRLAAVLSLALEKLPVTFFLVVFEVVSPTNLWVVLVIFMLAWLAQERLKWDRDISNERLEKGGKQGGSVVFLFGLIGFKALVDWMASGHLLSESLAFGAGWVVLFLAATLMYHDHRLLILQVEDTEEEVQRALAEARDAQGIREEPCAGT